MIVAKAENVLGLEFSKYSIYRWIVGVLPWVLYLFQRLLSDVCLRTNDECL